MPDEAAKKKVMQRALEWAVSFQCKNGGFAAFDKDVTKKWLQDVPFADHNAILDPPCSDITSRALEVFGRMGLSPKESFVRRSIRFVRETQLEDGSWEGAGASNYIYGTWLVLRGLRAIGEDMNQTGSCAAPIGWSRARTPTAAGARPVRPTTTRSSRARARARRRRRPGR